MPWKWFDVRIANITNIAGKQTMENGMGFATIQPNTCLTIHSVPTEKGNLMADETGIVLPWEKDAMAGLEMPNGLSYPDQILYLSLRMLYRQYYQKIIERDTATKEKKKLLDEYKVYQFREELEKQWVEIIRLTELARAEYRKNPCHENAMKLIDIIEGRKL